MAEGHEHRQEFKPTIGSRSRRMGSQYKCEQIIIITNALNNWKSSKSTRSYGDRVTDTNAESEIVDRGLNNKMEVILQFNKRNK